MLWEMEVDNKKELPKRKRLRLQNFDYSSFGAYFITVCTKDRKRLFAPCGFGDCAILQEIFHR